MKSIKTYAFAGAYEASTLKSEFDECLMYAYLYWYIVPKFLRRSIGVNHSARLRKIKC